MRALTSAELDAYDVVPRAIAARARIQRVPILAPGTSGMTLGRFILVRRDDDHRGTRKILAHELVHVRQYAELGFVGFLRRYLASYFALLWRLRSHTRAYLAIPFEVDAYSEADAWEARHAPAP